MDESYAFTPLGNKTNFDKWTIAKELLQTKLILQPWYVTIYSHLGMFFHEAEPVHLWHIINKLIWGKVKLSFMKSFIYRKPKKLFSQRRTLGGKAFKSFFISCKLHYLHDNNEKAWYGIEMNFRLKLVAATFVSFIVH